MSRCDFNHILDGSTNDLRSGAPKGHGIYAQRPDRRRRLIDK
jgi:hypothetical protein